MDLGIAGRVAIVTGSSRGLGRQAALSLAGEGVHLAICARGVERLEQTAAELRTLGVEVVAVAGDATVATDAGRLFDTATRTFGKVDIVVNNVGGRGPGGMNLEETTHEDLDQAFELNVFGALRLIRLAIPGMRERQWGRIINIASIFGREHGGTISYMTTKAALIAATKHLGLQLAKDGILVNSVAPGSILFNGGSWERFIESQSKEAVDDFIRVNLPMGRFGWPEPVGDLVAYLASERAGLITGSCINIDGGQSHSLI
jgi:3-oxoacyl-[acyl-carrier protein] reductase